MLSKEMRRRCCGMALSIPSGFHDCFATADETGYRVRWWDASSRQFVEVRTGASEDAAVRYVGLYAHAACDGTLDEGMNITDSQPIPAWFN